MNERETDPGAGWVLFDGDCGVCGRFVRTFGPPLRRRGFKLEALQADWVRARLNLSEEKLLEEMRVITPDDRVIGGADAMVWLARRLWWGWPVWVISFIPGVMPLMRMGYRWFARNRAAFGSPSCSIRNRPLPPERR